MNFPLRNMTALYLLRGEEVLLLYRIGSRVVGNSYTGTAGGHFEKEELNDPRACVLRELQEETGLRQEDIRDLTLRYACFRLKNGEIRQNYYFFARLTDPSRILESNEGTLRWVPLTELDRYKMPHTAKYVLQHYVAEGQFTEELYGCSATADGAVFTPLHEF